MAGDLSYLVEVAGRKWIKKRSRASAVAAMRRSMAFAER
jgi:hypothetical protein